MRPAVVTGLGIAHAGTATPAELCRPAQAPAGGSAAGGEDPVRRLTGPRLRYKDRATKLALCAARDALTGAGLLGEPGLTVAGETVGVVVSSNYGNVDTVCTTVETIARDTYLGTSPMTLPATASNVTASWVAIEYGLRGANLTICNGPTSGLDAVHWGQLLVGAGRVEAALVIGVEPDNAPVRALAGRPDLFDGAAALVVESVASARRRGVPVLAVLGRYARRASHAGAVAAVLGTDAGPLDLWCPPEGVDPGSLPEGSAAEPGRPAGTILDLARLGHASGAFGVLQCVAAAAWFAGGPGRALVSAGTPGPAGRDDAAAALTLAGARG